MCAGVPQYYAQSEQPPILNGTALLLAAVLMYSLLYNDVIHNTLSTLLTHRHMNMHRNRQCKSALATAVPRGPEKPPRKQQGHTQHQERRLSDGNINRLNHKTIADFC